MDSAESIAALPLPAAALDAGATGAIDHDPMHDGNPTSRILIVAQSPGREEVEVGRPLVGASGRLLWRTLGLASITRDQCYIVNLIGELPEGKSATGRAEAITPKQAARWREQFYAHVARSQADVVIVLGGPALVAFTGLRGGIEAWRGYVVKPESLPHEVTIKRPTAVHRKSDVKCKCISVRIEEVIGPKGGVKRKRIRTIDAECKVCEGTGVSARAGDVSRIVNRNVGVPPPARLLPNVRFILPVLHPASVLMSGYTLLPVLKADLMRASRALRGELRMATCAFDEAPTIFAGDGDIAVDIETGGDGRIERVGVADEHRTFTIATNGADAAVRSLMSSGRLIIMHNAGFDEPRLRAAGSPITGRIFDTMLGTYMVQPDGRKGLNWAISLFLDAERHKHLSVEAPAYYNALDVRRTWDLVAPLRRELDRTGQREWFEGAVMSAVRTLIRMSERGLRVDMDRLPAWHSELEARDAELTREWESIAPGVNPNASGQVARLLDLPSADEDTLIAHKQRAEDALSRAQIDGASERIRDAARGSMDVIEKVSVLLALRKTRKLIGTYAELEVSADGCVHPSYLPGAKDEDDSVGKGIAYSGRWTARDPNIQQQPKSARRLFIPHVRGNVLLEADWNQAELRITAALSGDAQLAADLDAGEHPVHGSGVAGQVAAAIGCTRKVAKVGLYLSAYLGSPKLLHNKFRAEGVAISYSECQDFQRKLFARYWKWAGWRREVMAEAQRKRELRNCFGKWAPFPGGMRDASKAVNFFPQSINACLATLVLPQLERELGRYDAHLLTLVHDSFLVECGVGAVDSVARVLRDVMGMEFKQVRSGFRIPVSVKRGLNWEEMAEMEAVQ